MRLLWSDRSQSPVKRRSPGGRFLGATSGARSTWLEYSLGEVYRSVFFNSVSEQTEAAHVWLPLGMEAEGFGTMH